jgi:hypothetical protein
MDTSRILIIAAVAALATAGCVHKSENTRMLSDEARTPDRSSRPMGQSPFDRAFGRTGIKSDPNDYWH